MSIFELLNHVRVEPDFIRPGVRCKLTDGTVKLGHFERWLIAPGEGVPKLGVIDLRDLQHCAADDRQVRDFGRLLFTYCLSFGKSV